MIEAKKNTGEIAKTWLTGQNSCTMIIPRDIAKAYGLEEPSHVVVEGTDKGILIRKLEV
jgi:antitoxin component of MazEF toxin-antitoxin module